MPITTNYQQLSYAGDGVTNSFPVVWQYQLQTDLVVHTLDTSTNTTTLLVLGTDYTVSPTLNSPANTGTVVTTTPPPALTNLLIARSVPLTQETTWVPNDPNLSTSTMNAVDKLTEIAQQLSANPFGLTGTTDQFLRGDNVLTNTLIGALGTPAIPADTTALFIAGQNADASIKVVGGSTSQAAFSFGTDGSTNPWDVRWVFDPQIAELGWQFYGGPILGTFDGSGNVSISGTYTGSADASLITSGTFPVARLGSGGGSGTSFLNGLGQFAIPTGGGGINTTTTGTFTIAAVNSTQTVPVTDATGIVVGTQLQIGDGSHIINGHVTVVASLNLTVKTDSIALGTSGNTMASGAAVQGSVYPGSNSILVDTIAFPNTPVTKLSFGGVLPLDPYSPIDLLVLGVTGGDAQVIAYVPNGGLRADAIAHDFVTPGAAGVIGAAHSVTGSTDYIVPSAIGQVLNCSAFSGGIATTVGFSLLGASNITPGSLTPALLNCTNSLTDQYVFGYDSGSGNFKMFSNTGLPANTNTGQFLRGDGAYSSILNLNASSGEGAGEFILANGVADNSYGVAFFGQPSGGTLAAWTMQKRVSGGWGVPTGVWTNYVIGVDGGTASVGSSWVSIDSTHAESLYLPLIARTDAAVRDVYGPLHKIYDIDMSGQSGTYPIDLINGAFQRMHGFTGTVTISLADTTPLPSNGAFRYESELTLELVDPGANIVGWAASGGSVVWANGASAPTLATTGKNVVKFIRSQDETYWIGTFIQPATGTGTVTSVASGSGLTGGPITTTGTLSIASGGVTASMIANNTITNSQISASANIATTKLALPGGTANFLRADGTWAVPPGTGGGGGGPTLAGTQTWTGVNTYSNNNIFNGRNVFSGPQIFNAGTFDSGNASGSVAIMGTYPADPVAPFQAAGVSASITNNDATNGGNVLALLVQQTNGPTASSGGTGTAVFNTVSECDNTGGFSISLQQRAWYAKNNGGVCDGVWLNSWGPSISYQSTPDGNGITHSFTSGNVRIGEVNYGNGWLDFGFIQDPGSAARAVSGIWFIPDYLPVGFGGTSSDPKFNVQWAIVIGAATSTFSSANTAKHWTGLLIDQDAVDHLGLDINHRGGSSSGNAPGAAVNIQNNYVTGINFAGSGGTTNGGTSATFSSTGNAAITMADDQSIKLGSIWLRGHSGALQYSTNGTAWSNVTLP